MRGGSARAVWHREMRLRSTRIRHCRSEGAGREPARTNPRCGRTRAGVSCEL